MSYHNTLAHEQPLLGEYQQKAMSQDEIILEFIRKYDNYPEDCIYFSGYTPSDIQSLALHEAPLTSVRRSMNTLTKQGKLIKTDETHMGPYGRPETIWRLAGPVQKDLFNG